MRRASRNYNRTTRTGGDTREAFRGRAESGRQELARGGAEGIQRDLEGGRRGAEGRERSGATRTAERQVGRRSRRWQGAMNDATDLRCSRTGGLLDVESRIVRGVQMVLSGNIAVATCGFGLWRRLPLCWHSLWLESVCVCTPRSRRSASPRPRTGCRRSSRPRRPVISRPCSPSWGPQPGRSSPQGTRWLTATIVSALVQAYEESHAW